MGRAPPGFLLFFFSKSWPNQEPYPHSIEAGAQQQRAPSHPLGPSISAANSMRPGPRSIPPDT